MVRHLILTVVGCAAFVILAQPASAAEPLVVAGSAPAAAHGPGTVPFTYSLQVGGDLQSVAVTTNQDTVLPADAASVRLDGTVVAPSEITRSGGNITVTLGAVSAGAHRLTFDAHAQATPSLVTSSSINVTYVAAGAQPAVAQSAAVRVDINEPDVVLDDGFGGGPVPDFSVGAGTFIALFLDVTNVAFGAPPTTLRIDLPNGLEIPADQPPCCTVDGQPLPCTQTTPGVLECALGRLEHGQHVRPELDLGASAAAVPGARATLKMAAIPDEGVDQNPTNNDATVRIHFTGLAHLVSRLTPPVVKVTVGKSGVVTVTVHNDGPQPADGAEAFVTLEDTPHFAVAAFDGNTPDPLSPSVQWLIGTLAPGQTVTAHVTVHASSAGTTHMSVDTLSNNGDVSSCNKKQCDTPVTLTASNAAPVVATPTPTPTPSSTGVTAGVGEVANTGAMPRPLVWLGVCMLLLGCASIGAAHLGRRSRLGGPRVCAAPTTRPPRTPH